jgi:hypothetical protein
VEDVSVEMLPAKYSRVAVFLAIGVLDGIMCLSCLD